MRCQPFIHCCRKHGTPHIHVVGSDSLFGVSWPVWGFAMSMKFVAYSIDNKLFAKRHRARLEKQLQVLHHRRTRDEHGRFSGIVLQKEVGGIDQASAVRSWIDFRKEPASELTPYYVTWWVGQCFAIPLACDFIQREGEEEVWGKITDIHELTKKLKGLKTTPLRAADLKLPMKAV